MATVTTPGGPKFESFSSATVDSGKSNEESGSVWGEHQGQTEFLKCSTPQFRGSLPDSKADTVVTDYGSIPTAAELCWP